MGGEFLATEDGEFELTVRDSNGTVLGTITADNLDSREQLYVALKGHKR